VLTLAKEFKGTMMNCFDFRNSLRRNGDNVWLLLNVVRVGVGSCQILLGFVLTNKDSWFHVPNRQNPRQNPAVGADQVRGCSGNVTESQNHRMVGVGRDLCGSSSPTLLLKQGHLQ